ncbi:hypothetical protein AQPE_2752 [Aquipluma nitroreducens]|uniref:Uncharacterized protein n=1 Tax=Aquipluma nitroreducens TaxID=2010828 RepID=A0A5K7SAT5_9BACT|nr:hypothetical protein AQPE_2752 [Aquipluma nitroreducens]
MIFNLSCWGGFDSFDQLPFDPIRGISSFKYQKNVDPKSPIRVLCPHFRLKSKNQIKKH